MAQTPLTEVEKAFLQARGISSAALDSFQPSIVFALGIGGGVAADPLAIAAGVDASGDIDEILRLLKNAQISTPILYTDDLGAVFAPETTLNPDTGVFARNYKTFPAGSPYAPQGQIRLLSEAAQSASGTLQAFERLSDGATIYGTYDPATATVLPYGTIIPLPASDFAPIEPSDPAQDYEVIRTAIATIARSPDYAVGDELINLLQTGPAPIADIWYNATQNIVVPDPDALHLAVGENPRVVLAQERLAVNYAQGAIASFVQPAVGGTVTVAIALETDLASETQFVAGAEVFVVAATGLTVAGGFEVIGGGLGALQLRRNSGFVVGAQNLAADGEVITGAKAIAVSRLNPPPTAEWAEITFDASSSLLQQLDERVNAIGQLNPEYSPSAKIRVERRLCSAFGGSSDLWSDRGQKTYLADGDRFIITAGEAANYRILALGNTLDTFASVTFGRGEQ